MLTIATFNLCNLGASTPSTRLARLGSIIAQDLEGPAILAVQEIMAENSPYATALPVPGDLAYQRLIAAIATAGGPTYDFREVAPLAGQDGGMVGANIRVGLLFDPTKVTFPDRGQAGPRDSTGLRFSNRRPALTLNPGRIAPDHPAFAGDSHRHWAPSRKALAAEFEMAGRPLFVVVCHFKSMRSINRRAEDYAKKQRHAQAEIIHQFAANLLACDPDAAVVLLGDLNDLPGSRTLKLLKGHCFHNLMDYQGRGQVYTRRHGGRPQALDHILISPSLQRGALVRIPHVNSDIPPKQEPASDHDPVMAVLPAFANSL